MIRLAVVTNGYALNEELVWNYLVNTMKLSKEKSCGIMAAVYTLSGFKANKVTNTTKDSLKGYYGLFQWKGSKWKVNYKETYFQGILGKSKKSTHYKNARYQMLFFHHDITNSVPITFWNKVKNASDSKNGAIEIYKSVFNDYNPENPVSSRGSIASTASSTVEKFWRYYIKDEDTGGDSSAETESTYDESSMDTTDYSSDSSIIVSNEFPAEEYDNLTNYDIYAEAIKANLSKFAPTGYDFYGYLIDLTHGGEFKFYIPEFNEAAGAEYQEIDIPGRSVTIRSYNKTNSRIINVSLDLYAGTGVYTGLSGTEATDKLHSDLNFVKSLEYPDYTNPIARPPSVVQLILGSAINITGVINSVTVNHLKPLDIQNRSMYAKLNFSVVQTAINPPDYTDIRNGSYSMTNTGDLSSLYSDSDNSDDIDSDADWFFNSVEYVYDKGYMIGTSEDSFEPDSLATRAQIVTVLWRVAGEPNVGSHNFPDVEKDSYYEKAVAWGTTNNIITGFDDNTFRPDQLCTREQAVVFLYRYAKLDGKDISKGKDMTIQYEDASSISNYALDAMKWAIFSSIIVGYNNKLNPTDSIKRSELAAIVERYERNL